MRSRARAVLYAMGVGMAVGCGAVLTFIASFGYNAPLAGLGSGSGAAFMVMNALPGTLLLGALFTGPSALVLVLAMAAAMRRWPIFTSAWLWGLAGAIAASPIAWLFGAGNSEDFLEFPSIHTTLLALGFVCGLAGRCGYREVGEGANLGRNPSTIA